MMGALTPGNIPCFWLLCCLSVSLLLVLYLVVPRQTCDHCYPDQHSKNIQNSHPNDDVIPRILHQFWDDYDVPSVFVPWIKSWILNNPDWEYWYWTVHDFDLMLSKFYPDFVSLNKAYTTMIKRADTMRYFVMHQFGGIYADLDMESLKPMDAFLSNHTCIISNETLEHAYFVHGRNQQNVNLINCILACRRKHPFYWNVINNLKSRVHEESVLKSTGPFFLTDVLNNYTKHLGNSSNEKLAISRIHPDFFVPTIASNAVPIVKKFCSTRNIQKYTQEHKDLCIRLKNTGYNTKPRQISYANHHWFHIYMQAAGWKQMTPKTSIFQVIPHAKKPREIFSNNRTYMAMK